MVQLTFHLVAVPDYAADPMLAIQRGFVMWTSGVIRPRISRAGFLLIGALLLNTLLLRSEASGQLLLPNWDTPSQWTTLADAGCTLNLSSLLDGQNGDGLTIEYRLKAGYGWVNMRKMVSFDVNTFPVTFLIKSASTDNLELKFTDSDGSVFGRKVPLRGKYANWTRVTVYINNTNYWWGGDVKFGTLAWFELAVSDTGSGTVWIDEIGQGQKDLPSSFPISWPVLDPDSTLAGIGFTQRRAEAMNPEDPGVLEWLNVMQDNGSTDKRLLPSQEGEDVAQTFNNSLGAMAFIVKGERERAERILDFYAAATVVNNTDLSLQNFYYQGEPRGFYQQVTLSTYRDNAGTGDRWIGDMAWLLCAYKMYDAKYTAGRYAKIEILIGDLFRSFYKPTGNGGFIQHGWRYGDRSLHESYGHIEGNIDCYAALALCDDGSTAGNIRAWLDDNLNNAVDLPLDNYTWRTLAFGQEAAGLLNTPEYDFRYRKILTVNGRKVMGFYHGPDIEHNNIWNDGTGHMACGFLSFGPRERGYFYSNQMDSVLIGKVLYGKKVRALPYTVNRSGGFAWVDTTKGFTSCAAWYIMAKNGVNPLRLTYSPTTAVGAPVTLPAAPQLSQNYPNPFNPSTTIHYALPHRSHVTLTVFNALGQEVAQLINDEVEAGYQEVRLDGGGLASGVYFYRLSAGTYVETKKLLHLR